MRGCAENLNPFIINNETIADVKEFTYLGSIVTKSGGAEQIEESQTIRFSKQYMEVQRILK